MKSASGVVSDGIAAPARPMSSAKKTPCTPGICSAAVASTPVITACAWRGSDEDDVLCARGVVGEEPAVPAEHAVVLPTPHRATDVARLRRFGGQWIRFSHCHNAIEMPNEMVISSMMVATIDG